MASEAVRRFQAHADAMRVLAMELRAELTPAQWERVGRFVAAMVTFLRLSAEMARAEEAEAPPAE
jgi:hypothetical protein